MVTHIPFDKPTEADLEAPDRMWLDQLAGRRNLDPSAFMGFINDLPERENWQGLFEDLPNGVGFVTKLSDFFARHQHGLRGQDGWYLYFHPLQRNALERHRLVDLAQRHVAELARIAGLAGAADLRERLSSLATVWVDEHRQRGPMMAPDSSNLDIEIYETIGDFLALNQDSQTWFRCLEEACYTLAADYGLQRYLMSDYYRIRFDYGAYYELWIGGGKVLLDDGGRCLVTPVQRR